MKKGMQVLKLIANLENTPKQKESSTGPAVFDL